MGKKVATLFFVILVFGLSACQAAPTEVEPYYIYPVEQQEPESTLEPELLELYQPPEPELPEPHQQVPMSNAPDLPAVSGVSGTFDTALAQFGDDELVRADSWTGRLENAALLDEWIENYRLGIPGRVAILVVSGPFLSHLFILESDGGATYKVTEYISIGRWWMGESEQGPPEVFESFFVVRRAYDYIFGYDFPEWYEGSEHRRFLGAVRVDNFNFDRFSHERLEWNPKTDAPLAGITPQQAKQRVRESYAAFGLDEPIDGWDIRTYFRIVGAMYLGENIYYVVYGHNDLEALNRGEHMGSVSAVSLDGRLVFMQSMAHGEWWLADDAQREVISP